MDTPPVRVLMVAWEYPPLVVGGIAAHVHGLATSMAAAGHDVVVLSVHHHDTPDDTVVDGVRILRAHVDLPWLPDEYMVGTTASANHHLVQLAALLGDWRPDVVHAHDWLVAWAADTLRALFGVPLVATIHATERGRHGGHLPMGTPAAINSAEWWLTYQAREVIACSRFMVREVVDGFELPPDKVHLIPNGIDVDHWRIERATGHDGGHDAARDDGPLVVAWGRIQYEKGFHVLAEAIGLLRSLVPGIHAVVAGRGSYLPELQARLDIDGVGDLVTLAGFMPADELRALLARASCVVIPSLYEPFGIVALEGMASGVPTVVARTGGLAEIAGGTDAALLFEPGNAADLALRIEQVVDQPVAAAAMTERAAHLLATRYTWQAISAATVQVYRRAVAQ